MNNEPVTSAGAVSAALIAVVNVIAIALSWKNDIVAALNLAIGAVVFAASFFVRSKVTPLVDPSLNQAQINKAQAKIS